MNTTQSHLPVYSGDFIRSSDAMSLNRNAPLWQRLESPSQYRPDAALVDAVNVAIALGQPLLLTGESGVGKTQLAVSLAAELHARDPMRFHSSLLRFETKSTSVGKDLFYEFDSIGRLYATKDGTSETSDPAVYLTLAALGKAIALVSPQTHDALRSKAGAQTDALVRSVVLIDEIDKAPRDLPNDLLNEIASMRFLVREMGGLQVEAARSDAPIVIITSNSEKQLPDPFLRRCVYHHIDFPSDHLAEILDKAIAPAGGQGGALMQDAISLFAALRAPNTRIEKRPGLAEFLTWMEAVSLVAQDDESALSGDLQLVKRTFGVLFKTKSDLERGSAEIYRWAQAKAST